jgi:RimJ/RimL family protein N-acetyltransferase
MLRINNPEDRAAVAKLANVSAQPHDTVIARVEGEVLYCGFIFTNYTGKGGSIWGHVAAFHPRAFNKKVLRAVFEYTFNQLQCRCMFTKVAERNKKSLDFNTKLGFTKIGHLAEVYPDGSGQIIFRMKKLECRWLIKDEVPIIGSIH